MNCAAAQAVMDLFVEDRLTPSRRREVETHLNGCAPCAAASHLNASQEPAVKAPAALLAKLKALSLASLGGEKAPLRSSDFRPSATALLFFVFVLAALHWLAPAASSERPVSTMAAPWRLP